MDNNDINTNKDKNKQGFAAGLGGMGGNAIFSIIGSLLSLRNLKSKILTVLLGAGAVFGYQDYNSKDSHIKSLISIGQLVTNEEEMSTILRSNCKELLEKKNFSSVKEKAKEIQDCIQNSKNDIERRSGAAKNTATS